MKISNLKVKTPAIPSRTAANQFIDQHGYDMEWVPQQGLFYVHDQEKDKLHVIAISEVTNFAIATSSPSDFMKALRAKAAPAVAVTTEAPSKPKVASK